MYNMDHKADMSAPVNTTSMSNDDFLATQKQTYLYNSDSNHDVILISIWADGNFSYSEGSLSSYYGLGKWEIDDNYLILRDDSSSGYPLVNYFILMDNSIVFVEDLSTNFVNIRLCDGDEFILL